MSFTIYRTDGNGGLISERQSLRAVGPTEVRIAVKAIGLNFRDHYVVRGNRFRVALNGRVPFSDAVGVVEECGSAVSRFKKGDRVCTIALPNWIDGPLSAHAMSGARGSQDRDGVLAEQLYADQNELIGVPAYLNDSEAATLPIAALTAWHAIAQLESLKADDTVVVQTTGGVAVFAIQFARGLKANVIVVSRSADKLRMAQDLGATGLINSDQTPEWEKEVLKQTGGKGAQLVLDMGLTDSLRRSVLAAAYEATVAIIGVVQEHTNPLDMFPVFNKNIRLRGVETGSRAMFEVMNSFLEKEEMRPVIDAEFNVKDVHKALDRLANSPFGKVVVCMNH